MSATTLTIRNLDETVKQKLRLQAAHHQRSMEAEARDILARALERTPEADGAEERRRRLQAVAGLWRDRGGTDELMAMTRGED